MGGPAENSATAKRYIHAIESGTLGGQIAEFFAYDSYDPWRFPNLAWQSQTHD